MHRLATLVDFFFPPSESGLLLRHTSSEAFRSLYAPQHHQTVTTLCTYQEPVIKAAITAGKFEHNLEALQLLAHLLAQHLHTWPYEPSRTAIVPVPLHPKRQPSAA